MSQRRLNEVIGQIESANRILLTTHKHADGDGLGAEIALYRAFCSIGKSVRMLNVDRPDSKYSFLTDGLPIETWGGPHEPFKNTDLAIVLDTNDSRLVEPLFSELQKHSDQMLFIDHHPLSQPAPPPPDQVWIETDAASTGELCFRLIRALFANAGRAFTSEIAAALYTSVVFDTQLFRFIRQSPASHLRAAELLQIPFDAEAIHRALFATSSVAKLKFLAGAFNRIEYSDDGQIAFITVNQKDLSGIAAYETGDLIDTMINIASVEVAALLREESAASYKLSLRSKGRIQVLPIVAPYGGGGHPYAAGAYLAGNAKQLREQILSDLRKSLGQPR